jgi:ubiquinone/menaquinone biosynthesis C-methylase UbiE
VANKQDSPVDLLKVRRDELLDRLSLAQTAMMEVCSVYLGDQLGYYTALAEHGPLTSRELATKTSTAERYAREWLEQQTVAGLLELENVAAEPADRRFVLPPGHDEVLANRDSLSYFPPAARLVLGTIRPIAEVVEAYRSGAGVPYEAFGEDLSAGLADAGRMAFLKLLGRKWIPALPEIDARLRAKPPARVADLGCGAAWSCIALAQAFPDVRVDGFDLDPASVELAQQNVREAGLEARVTVEVRDAASEEHHGEYDLAITWFCLHDMTDSVAVLGAMKRLVREDGSVVVVETPAAEQFMAEDTNFKVERKCYGFSVLHCLPVGLSEAPAAGTGTVMRPEVLRGYAHSAGFRDITITVADAWTVLYRLIP